MDKVVGRLLISVLIGLVISLSRLEISQASQQLLFGQKHFYSVLFRGNGESIVTARIVIPNPEQEVLKEFSFEIPEANPSEMTIYQIKLPPECIKYNYNAPDMPCLEYQEPDYSQDYYSTYPVTGNQKIEYQKVEYTRSEDRYSFTFPTDVSPYKATAIVLAYATKDYVSQSFGLFKFNFETIRVASRIKLVRVAADVDTDLVLKARDLSLNYTDPGLEVPQLGDAAAISSRDLDRVVENIGLTGAILKEVENLAPNESFNFKGEYAENWFRLYLREIILAGLIIGFTLGLAYFLVKFWSTRSVHQTADRVNLQADKQRLTYLSFLSGFSFGAISNALLSVILLTLLTYLLRLIMLSYFWQSVLVDPVFRVLSLVIIILVYGLIILLPAVFSYIGKGIAGFISVILLQAVWLIIFLSLYLILFRPADFGQPPSQPVYPLPKPLEYNLE